MSDNTDFTKLLAPHKEIERKKRVSLKGVHAYRNVSYVDNDLRKCNLCETYVSSTRFRGWPNQIQLWEEHVRSEMHVARYRQLEHAQNHWAKQHRRCRLDRTTFLRERARRLMLPAWRWHMSDLILQYIDSPPLSFDDPDELKPWEIALTQLCKYEHKECLSLLEMAILKYRLCICDHYPCTCNSRWLDCARDSRNNRKRSNDAITVDLSKGGAAIIIPKVLEFLGGLPLCYWFSTH